MTKITPLLLLLAACHPSVPGPPDARDSSPAPAEASDQCAAACANMAHWGCSEGADPACPLTLSKVEADKLMRSPAGQPITCACLAAAASILGIQNCGSSCSQK